MDFDQDKVVSPEEWIFYLLRNEKAICSPFKPIIERLILNHKKNNNKNQVATETSDYSCTDFKVKVKKMSIEVNKFPK